MVDKFHRDDSVRKEALMKLIALADELEVEGDERPSQDTIVAYLGNIATDSQKNAIYRAMNRSRAFREEMLCLTEDFEAFVGDESRARFSSTQATELSGESDRDAASERSSARSFRLRDILHVKLIVPAVAAAILLLAFYLPFRSASNWIVVERQMDPAEVVSYELRGSDNTERSELFTSAEAAAKHAFRQLLFFDGIDFKVRPARPTFGDSMSSDSAMLAVVIEADTVAVLGLPSSGQDGESQLVVWWLLVPSRELRKMAVAEEQSLVVLENTSVSAHCFTLTYRTNRGFRTVDAISIGF